MTGRFLSLLAIEMRKDEVVKNDPSLRGYYRQSSQQFRSDLSWQEHYFYRKYYRNRGSKPCICRMRIYADYGLRCSRLASCWNIYR